MPVMNVSKMVASKDFKGNTGSRESRFLNSEREDITYTALEIRYRKKSREAAKGQQ